MAIDSSGTERAPVEKAERQVLLVVYVGDTLHDVTNRLLVAALNYVKGNRTYAARMLGISVRTLQRRLKTYCRDFKG